MHSTRVQSVSYVSGTSCPILMHPRLPLPMGGGVAKLRPTAKMKHRHDGLATGQQQIWLGWGWCIPPAIKEQPTQGPQWINPIPPRLPCHAMPCPARLCPAMPMNTEITPTSTVSLCYTKPTDYPNRQTFPPVSSILPSLSSFQSPSSLHLGWLFSPPPTTSPVCVISQETAVSWGDSNNLNVYDPNRSNFWLAVTVPSHKRLLLCITP